MRRFLLGVAGAAVAALPQTVVSAGPITPAGAAPHGREVAVGLPPGYEQGFARDVNEHGVIVVNAFHMTSPTEAVTQMFTVDVAGRWTPLRPAVPAEDRETALVINDAGVVLGSSLGLAGGDRECPFLLVPGSTARCIDDAGSTQVPAKLTQGSDMNDSGVVVGGGVVRQPDGSYAGSLPMTWTAERGASPLPLRSPDTWGYASAINEHGQILGRVGTSPFHDDGRPVVWSPPSYRPVELVSDHTRVRSIAINDDGVVLGAGVDAEGHGETLVWSRPGRRPRVIPEPNEDDLDDDGAVIGVTTEGEGWVAARFDPRTLEPELLTTPDHLSEALYSAGEHLVGWSAPDPETPAHIVRFHRP
jgi:hypothetical protein